MEENLYIDRFLSKLFSIFIFIFTYEYSVMTVHYTFLIEETTIGHTDAIKTNYSFYCLLYFYIQTLLTIWFPFFILYS